MLPPISKFHRTRYFTYYILHIEVLYDRGVKFGLAGGRFESVMVSGRPFPFSLPALSRSF